MQYYLKKQAISFLKSSLRNVFVALFRKQLFTNFPFLLVDCPDLPSCEVYEYLINSPTCHQSLLSSPLSLFLITSVLLPPQRWWGIIPLSSTLCWSKGDRTGDKHNNRMANKYHWKLRHALNTEKRLTFE